MKYNYALSKIYFASILRFSLSIKDKMGMAQLLLIVATVAIIMFAECKKKGIDPASGFNVEYGCYKSKCWSYCTVKIQIN